MSSCWARRPLSVQQEDISSVFHTKTCSLVQQDKKKNVFWLNKKTSLLVVKRRNVFLANKKHVFLFNRRKWLCARTPWEHPQSYQVILPCVGCCGPPLPPQMQDFWRRSIKQRPQCWWDLGNGAFNPNSVGTWHAARWGEAWTTCTQELGAP